MNGMNLNAVNACLFAQSGSLGKSVNNLFNFLNGEGAAGYLIRPAGGKLARACALILNIKEGL